MANNKTAVYTNWMGFVGPDKLMCHEGCVEMNMHTTSLANGKWYDLHCHQRRQCVCQFDNVTREGATKAELNADNSSFVAPQRLKDTLCKQEVVMRHTEPGKEPEKETAWMVTFLALMVAALAWIVGNFVHGTPNQKQSSSRVESRAIERGKSFMISVFADKVEAALENKYAEVLVDSSILPYFVDESTEKQYRESVWPRGGEGQRRTAETCCGG